MIIFKILENWNIGDDHWLSPPQFLKSDFLSINHFHAGSMFTLTLPVTVHANVS